MKSLGGKVTKHATGYTTKTAKYHQRRYNSAQQWLCGSLLLSNVSFLCPRPLGGGIKQFMLSDFSCLSVCLSVTYIVNFHGAKSYWKQGALGAAGVRRVWAGAGPHRAEGEHIARLPAQLVVFSCLTRVMLVRFCLHYYINRQYKIMM